MNAYFAAYIAILFFLLSPGVLLRLPARGSRLVVAVAHGLVFVVALYLTKHVVLRVLYGMGCMYEGFQDMPPQDMPPQAQPDMAAVEAQANQPMPEMAQPAEKMAQMPQPMLQAPGKPQTLVDFSGINLSIVNAGASPPGSQCSSGTQCARGICINARCL